MALKTQENGRMPHMRCSPLEHFPAHGSFSRKVIIKRACLAILERKALEEHRAGVPTGHQNVGAPILVKGFRSRAAPGWKAVIPCALYLQLCHAIAISISESQDVFGKLHTLFTVLLMKRRIA